jgi:hypothetical protein
LNAIASRIADIALELLGPEIEAVTRPTMRFVAIKTKEQQAVLVMHRARDLLVRQRTQLINALRGLLAEFGISEPQGSQHVGRLRAHLDEDTVPETGREVLRLLVEQLDALEKRVTVVDAKIRGWHRGNPISQRLAKVPGVGPLIATAIVATVGDASLFRSGREFAAWLGLTPSAELHRWQATPWPDYTPGRCLHPAAIDHRGTIRTAVFEGDEGECLGSRASKPLREAESCSRTCKQNSANHLGPDGKGGLLPPGVHSIDQPPRDACERNRRDGVSGRADELE